MRNLTTHRNFGGKRVSQSLGSEGFRITERLRFPAHCTSGRLLTHVPFVKLRDRRLGTYPDRWIEGWKRGSTSRENRSRSARSGSFAYYRLTAKIASRREICCSERSRSAEKSVSRRSAQIIKHDFGHGTHADWNRGIVSLKIGRMVYARRRPRFLSANKKEKTRNNLAEIGEIVGGHYRGP